MRGRMIELLKKADEYASGVCTDYAEAQEVCADYIIAEGGASPPCKVGQTVYSISRGRVKEWKVYFIGVNLRGEFNIRIADEPLNNSREWWDRDIGTWIFLTRAEAERALAEREGKG